MQKGEKKSRRGRGRRGGGGGGGRPRVAGGKQGFGAPTIRRFFGFSKKYAF